MSGFENAGAVLGAFPIAIAALDQCRELAMRLGRFTKIQVEHKKCRGNLEFYRLLFTGNLRQLVLPLAVDESKVEVLLSRPGGPAWRDPVIETLLEKRLGYSYVLYVEYMQGIRMVMEYLGRELAMDSKAVQDRLSSSSSTLGETQGRIQAIKDRVMFELYRAKFSANLPERNQTFNQIQGFNDKLEKLLGSSDNDQRISRDRATKQLASMESVVSTSWIQVRSLFRILASNWKCQCQGREAKLLLHSRVEKQTEFQAIFAHLTSTNWQLHATGISQGTDAVAALVKQNITIIESPEQLTIRQPHHRQGQPSKSALRSSRGSTATTATSVRHLRPPPSVTLTAIGSDASLSNVSQITSICEYLRVSGESPCGYLVGEDARYYVKPVSCRASQVAPTTITLGTILSGAPFPTPNRKQRYSLATIIATSFVQLFDTPWLPLARITKTDIHFLSDPDDSNVFLLGQPHIRRSDLVELDPGKSTSTTGRATTANYSDALDQLGILLLELCFGTVIEAQSYRRERGEGSTDKENACFDVIAARDWQRNVNSEGGHNYAEAVAWCLGGNRSAPPERWRQLMLRRVVQPLQRSRDHLDGKSADVDDDGDGML
ncbi:hypothetical protein OQA88_10276 [Cercophora sp. LCS_1]